MKLNVAKENMLNNIGTREKRAAKVMRTVGRHLSQDDTIKTKFSKVGLSSDDLLKEIQIKPDDSGTEVLTIRQTRTGCVLLELGRKITD
ncbi:hypothetical protein J6590_096476, partial [Homalodisca vitripennis]